MKWLLENASPRNHSKQPLKVAKALRGQQPEFQDAAFRPVNTGRP